MNLTARQSQVLAALVDSYLSTGKPVSSQVVAERKLGRRLSSATIRNELKTLTDQGFVRQLHQSGGRVPTGQGLRTYLDQLMRPKLHPWDRTHLDTAARAQNHTEL